MKEVILLLAGFGLGILLHMLRATVFKPSRKGKRERKDDVEVIDFRHDIGLDFTGRKVNTYLNKRLAQRNAVSHRRFKMIESVHAMREHLFDVAQKIEKEDPKQVHVINVLLFHMELCLQELWNFKKEVDFHSWWYQLPGCTCPKMDNEERLGRPGRITSTDCPFHGEEFHKSYNALEEAS